MTTMASSDHEIDSLMHPKEVADKLQVSERTVIRWAVDPIMSRKIGAKRVGRRCWRFLRWRVELYCNTLSH